MAIIKKLENNNCWRGCREIRALVHCWWGCKMMQLAALENCCAAVPQKNPKKQSPCDPAIPFLGIYPKELKEGTQTDFYAPMFAVALFTIATRHFPQGSTNPHASNGISCAWKRKAILTHATTWANLEDILLNENKPVTKDRYCIIPRMLGAPSSQIHQHRK